MLWHSSNILSFGIGISCYANGSSTYVCVSVRWAVSPLIETRMLSVEVQTIHQQMAPLHRLTKGKPESR